MVVAVVDQTLGSGELKKEKKGLNSCLRVVIVNLLFPFSPLL